MCSMTVYFGEREREGEGERERERERTGPVLEKSSSCVHRDNTPCLYAQTWSLALHAFV